MKRNKEKQRILKIRPFNMANFSGGSGYLVFSIIYQAMAMLPAMVIIWLTSLIRLPKLENSDEIDYDKAVRRYNIISIPLCVIIAIFGVIMACINNYGTFKEYWIEILFIGIVPAICLFFIIRFCHKQIIEHNAGIAKMVALSVVFTIIALIGILLICAGCIDPILTEIADQNYDY